MNFLSSLYHYYDIDNKVIGEEIFVWDVYGIITVEINTDYFIAKNFFKMLKARCKNVDKKNEK